MKRKQFLKCNIPLIISLFLLGVWVWNITPRWGIKKIINAPFSIGREFYFLGSDTTGYCDNVSILITNGDTKPIEKNNVLICYKEEWVQTRGWFEK